MSHENEMEEEGGLKRRGRRGLFEKHGVKVEFKYVKGECLEGERRGEWFVIGGVQRELGPCSPCSR